jgi:uncharacterized protein YukE
MSNSLELTPEALSAVVYKMEHMSYEIKSTAGELSNASSRIKTKWDDDQYEVFSERMKSIITELQYMADNIEQEKDRVIQYQRDTQNAANNF